MNKSTAIKICDDMDKTKFLKTAKNYYENDFFEFFRSRENSLFLLSSCLTAPDVRISAQNFDHFLLVYLKVNFRNSNVSFDSISKRHLSVR